jgi:hypothetical protein
MQFLLVPCQWAKIRGREAPTDPNSRDSNRLALDAPQERPGIVRAFVDERFPRFGIFVKTQGHRLLTGNVDPNHREILRKQSVRGKTWCMQSSRRSAVLERKIIRAEDKPLPFMQNENL